MAVLIQLRSPLPRPGGQTRRTLVRGVRLADAVLGGWLLAGALAAGAAAAEAVYVRVSPRDVRYFELSDARPYIPIGLNLIAPDGPHASSESSGLARMQAWMNALAENGGNFFRVWLSSPFWDVEHERSGVYDEAKARRIDALLELAHRHGLRAKLTLEHFREMSSAPRQRWANKPLHLTSQGGPATNMADFFSGAASRQQFRRKLAWFAERYGPRPAIFGWELWNEINAVAAAPEHWLPWTEEMLAELHRLLPRHLAMQSLGSFDTARVRPLYRQVSLLPGNDVAQVHRYLDLGASLEVCGGPVDVLAADAVRELLSYQPKRPVILAESGAVEPRHTGPFKLYAKDKAGIILHDVLFAPFFAGAAGAGQIWHWDAYVDRNSLWHHFGRFAEAVKGLDPPAEAFEPVELPHPRLRVYALQGRRTTLVWCRDSQNTWQTELEHGQPPERLEGLSLDLSGLPRPVREGTATVYDPWNHRHLVAARDGARLRLPAFSRSVVVRLNAR